MMNTRRIATILINAAGLCAMLVATIGLAIWLTGRIVSDRYEWSQWIAWIPMHITIALALLGFLGAWRPGGGKRKRRIRRLVWATTVLVFAGWFVLIEHHFITGRDCNARGLRIVHWNSSAVGPDAQTNAAQQIVDINGAVTILTNPSRIPYKTPIRNWLSDGGTVLRLQAFAVITTLPVLEARRVVSMQHMHVAILRLDAREQLGRELTLWLIDLPSAPEQSRMETARKVRAWIDKTKLPSPDIIVGDFNMTRGSASLKTIAPDHRHAFDVAGVGYGATYPREHPWLHIDHMLLAEDIQPLSYCIHDPGAGTHRLQVLTLEYITNE